MQITIDNFESLFDLFGQHFNQIGLDIDDYFNQYRILQSLIASLMMLHANVAEGDRFRAESLNAIDILWADWALFTEANANDRVKAFLIENSDLSARLKTLVNTWMDEYEYGWDPREYQDMIDFLDLLEGLHGGGGHGGCKAEILGISAMHPQL